jgi:hypothetical protein
MKPFSRTLGSPWAAPCLLIAAVFCTFAVSLSNPLVNWDDYRLIGGHEPVRELSLSSIRYVFTHFDPELYIPLALLSYQVEQAVFGFHPAVFHATSLLLHILNALLAWMFLRIFLKSPSFALLGALLFALHPIQTEAVAWASARKDLLASFFALLSLLLYVHSSEKKYRIGTVITFALALLSKVSVVTLPLIFLLIDWREKGGVTMRDVFSKWPHFLLSLVFGLVAIFGKSHNLSSLTLLETVLLSFKATVFYLWQIFVPFHFSAFYEQSTPILLTSAEFLVPIALFALLLGAAAVSLRWTKEGFFAFAWYLLFIAPSVATFMKAEGEVFFASDRYAYLALLGIILAIIRFIEIKVPKKTHLGISLLLIIFSFGFAGKSFLQTQTWAGEEALFGNAVRAYPESFVAQHNLGYEYLKTGRYELAIEQLTKAIEMDPMIARAHANLGAAYGKIGEYEKGLDEILKSLKLDPEKQDEYRESLRMIEEAKRKAQN